MNRLMSPRKIWRAVKEQRAKQNEKQIQEDEWREQLESAVGRNIEASNQRELAQWEAVYGDRHASQPLADSVFGSSTASSPKHSVSVREQKMDDFDTVDVTGNGSQGPCIHELRPAVSVRMASNEEDETPPTGKSHELLSSSPEVSRATSQRSANRNGAEYATLAPSTRPPKPSVIDLPSRLPEEAHTGQERRSAISEDSPARFVQLRRGVSPSCPSFQKQQSEGALEVPCVEDDRASSVAATADDLLADHRLSAMPSPYAAEFHLEDHGHNSDVDAEALPEETELPLEEEDDEVLNRVPAAQSHPTPNHSSDNKAQDRRNSSIVGSLQDHLPEKISKVAVTHRTHEWAKRIADADEPETQDVSDSYSPGTQIDGTYVEEAARPVDMKALQESSCPTGPTNNSPHNKESSSQQSRNTPNSTRSSSGWINEISSDGESKWLSRGKVTNRAYPKLTTSHLRSVSAPYTSQPLAESPLEDVLASSGPYRNNVPRPPNLMDRRNNMLKQRITTGSFNAAYSTPNYNSLSPSDSIPIRDVLVEEPENDKFSLAERRQLLEDDNMSLAQRRQLVRHQQQYPDSAPMSPAARNQRQGTYPPLANQGRYNRDSAQHGHVTHDSHQPRRARAQSYDTPSSSTRLMQWRQGLDAGTRAEEPLLLAMAEHARQTMLLERRQAEWIVQKQHEERKTRQDRMDSAMRMGHLDGAHRDVLRRLQAQAQI